MHNPAYETRYRLEKSATKDEEYARKVEELDRLYGGCPFPVLEVFQVHQHPLFQLFISEAFPKSGTLERRADHLAGNPQETKYCAKVD